MKVEGKIKQWRFCFYNKLLSWKLSIVRDLKVFEETWRNYPPMTKLPSNDEITLFDGRALKHSATTICRALAVSHFCGLQVQVPSVYQIESLVFCKSGNVHRNRSDGGNSLSTSIKRIKFSGIIRVFIYISSRLPPAPFQLSRKCHQSASVLLFFLF